MNDFKTTLESLLKKYGFVFHPGSDLVQEQLNPDMSIEGNYTFLFSHFSDGVYTHVFLVMDVLNRNVYKIYITKSNVKNIEKYAKETFITLDNNKMVLNSLEDAFIRKGDVTIPVFKVVVPPIHETLKKSLRDVIIGFMKIIKP